MTIINTLFKRIAFITIILGCQSSFVGGQTNNGMAYLGQEVPSTTPMIFAKNIISLPDRYEFGSVFSKDGKEFFFGLNNKGKSEIHYSALINAIWTTPKLLLDNAAFSNNDPMLSPDENRLYFISDRSLNNTNKKKDIDIWYVERTKEGWSSPINAGGHINSPKEEYYISFTDNGTMYFSSNIDAEEASTNNFDIYSAAYKDDQFESPVRLSEAINTSGYEADVFVAPDESYIIFCAKRCDGLGQGDLYISFKNDQGAWTPSKNMGSTINTDGHELCPFVSMDGKYFFYTSNKDIY